MYVYKNAFKNITRNVGRNVLIGLIIFAIIATTVVSLTIRNTSSAVIEDYRNRFGSEVIISVDIQSMMANMGGFGGFGRGGRAGIGQVQMSNDLMLTLAGSDLLHTSIATARLAVNSNDIRAIDQTDEDIDIAAGFDLPGGMFGGGRGMGGVSELINANMGNFTLIGDDWETFQNGNRAIIDGGRFPESDGESVISYELAEENGLSIGDTVVFEAAMSRQITDDLDTSNWYEGHVLTIGGVEYTVFEPMEGMFVLRRFTELELTVVGIYVDLSPEYANTFFEGIAAFNTRNEIHTNVGTIINLHKANETNINLDITYVLRYPELLGRFEAYARANGLPDHFLISTDMATYEAIVRPVVGMKNISLTFMIIILLLGAAILVLLNSIAIRERKYEIGVLRAMGMKKRKVAMGLLSELFMLTAICLVLGIVAGSVAAQPIADILIRHQAEAAQPVVDEQSPWGGMGGMGAMFGGGRGGMMRGIGGMLGQTQNTAQPLDEIDVNVGIGTIGQIIGIALLLSAFAGLISVSRITKYEPIKILMERN